MQPFMLMVYMGSGVLFCLFPWVEVFSVFKSGVRSCKSVLGWGLIYPAISLCTCWPLLDFWIAAQNMKRLKRRRRNYNSLTYLVRTMGTMQLSIRQKVFSYFLLVMSQKSFWTSYKHHWHLNMAGQKLINPKI